MKRLDIVVIEDDPAVNEAVVLILRKSGHQVRTFFTLEAHHNAGIEGADAYLIDRQLRGEDGLELCKELKSEEATMNIPVIIMSASPDSRLYAERAGADAFLDKPFSKKQLLEELERVIMKENRLVID